MSLEVAPAGVAVLQALVERAGALSAPQAARGQRPCEQSVHPLHAFGHHPRNVGAVLGAQVEAAKQSAIGAMAADEAAIGRAAGIEPVQADFGDQNVGGPIQVDDVAPPSASRAPRLRRIDQ